MDNFLLLRIREGDGRALEELYNMYGEYALRTAAAVMGSSAAAADIVQEAFIRVYYNIGSFDMSRPFKPWFYKILINECNRYLKDRTRTVFIDDYMKAANEMTGEDKYSFEEFEELYAAVRNLEDKNRIAIVLKYLSGFQEKEIAGILGVNVNTVKSRLFKGRQKLRKLLQDYGGRRNNNE